MGLAGLAALPIPLHWSGAPLVVVLVGWPPVSQRKSLDCSGPQGPCYVARMLSPSRFAATSAALLLGFAVLAFGAPAAAATSTADAQSVAARGTPARVDGLWCGMGLLNEFTLEIAQRYHDFEAKLVRKGRVREITGRVEGSMVRTDPQRNETLELEALDDQLRITGGTGPLALARGQSFARASGGSCSH